jgi:hypothetical protein
LQVVVVLLSNGQEEVLLESELSIHDEQCQLTVILVGLEVRSALVFAIIFNTVISFAFKGYILHR